jgi:hypothetical protein
MKEQLDSLTYTQLLKVARAYNLGVSIPMPANISKEDLVGNIMKHATQIGRLLEVLASVRGEEKPMKEELPKIKKTAGMDEDEFQRMKRQRERDLRKIARAKLIYEPIVEGEEMSKADKKALKERVSAVKDKYKSKPKMTEETMTIKVKKNKK